MKRAMMRKSTIRLNFSIRNTVPARTGIMKIKNRPNNNPDRIILLPYQFLPSVLYAYRKIKNSAHLRY